MLDLQEQYDKIYRYCYFKLYDRNLAEDITQETFLKYYEHYSFNNESAKTEINGQTEIALQDHVENGVCLLRIYLKNGNNVYERTFTYKKVELKGDLFNVVNLDEKYFSDEYELYIWSWSPGAWSQNYEIRDGVLLVDTAGMTGFLLAAFEKGYQIEDPNKWESHVIKQSADIKGEMLDEGFVDLSGF